MGMPRVLIGEPSAEVAGLLERAIRCLGYEPIQWRPGQEVPDADVVVLEPRPEELPRLMRNIMRTSGRVRIAEYAYRSTQQKLDAEYPRLSRVFARHGLRLRPATSISRAPLRSKAALVEAG